MVALRFLLQPPLWLSCLWPDICRVLTVRGIFASVLCQFVLQKGNDALENSGLHAAPPRHCSPWPQTDQVGIETWVQKKYSTEELY